MTPKNNTPDRMEGEKGTDTKRRYQSPQTPPQESRTARQGTQQKRGDGQQGNPSHGDGHARRDFDLERASREELNAIARDLHIDSYASMNRDQLVSQIKDRS